MSSALHQVGILAENLVARAACGDEPDDGSDGDPHPADAWLSPHYGGVTGDAGQLWHGGLTPVVNVSIVGHPQPQAKSKPPSSQNTRDGLAERLSAFGRVPAGRWLGTRQADRPLVEHVPVFRLVEHERTDGTVRLGVGDRRVVIVLKRTVAPNESIERPLDERCDRTAAEISAFGAHLQRNTA